MDPASIGKLDRDHYLEQFRYFVERRKSGAITGTSEVKLKLDNHSELFENFYCTDFVRNDDGPVVVEFCPERLLKFGAIQLARGPVFIEIENLRWDSVHFKHDLETLSHERLSPWFQRLFDPDDAHHDQSAEFSEVVHSCLVESKSIQVDFGTSPADAFGDLILLLIEEGAIRVLVSSRGADEIS